MSDCRAKRDFVREMRGTAGRYYHAGCGDPAVEPDGVVWSHETHADFDAARDEARAMAAECGGRAVVESWDASHGPRPGDADAVDETWCEGDG